MVLSAVPILRVCSDVLGLQLMIPQGLDKQYRLCVTLAGVVNVVLAVALARHWSYMGAAWAIVLSEVLLTSGIWLSLTSGGADPFTPRRELTQVMAEA
jgi:PST family polysaccharide transporter